MRSRAMGRPMRYDRYRCTGCGEWKEASERRPAPDGKHRKRCLACPQTGMPASQMAGISKLSLVKGRTAPATLPERITAELLGPVAIFAEEIESYVRRARPMLQKGLGFAKGSVLVPSDAPLTAIEVSRAVIEIIQARLVKKMEQQHRSTG